MPCFDAAGDDTELIGSVDNIGSPDNPGEIVPCLVTQRIPTDIVGAVVVAEENVTSPSEVADQESQGIGSPDGSDLLPLAFDEMLSIPTSFIGDAGAAVSSSIDVSLANSLLDNVSFSDSFADIVQDIPTDISIGDITAFNASILDVTRPSGCEHATFELGPVGLRTVGATDYIAEPTPMVAGREMADNLDPEALVCGERCSERFVDICTQNIPDGEGCDSSVMYDGIGLADNEGCDSSVMYDSIGLADGSEGVSIIIMSNIPTDVTDASPATDLNVSSGDSTSAIAAASDGASESMMLLSPTATAGNSNDVTAPISFNIGSPDPKADADEGKSNAIPCSEDNYVFSPERCIGSPDGEIGSPDVCDTAAQSCLIPVVSGEMVTFTVRVSNIGSPAAVVAHKDVTNDVEHTVSGIDVNEPPAHGACDTILSADIASPDGDTSVPVDTVGVSLSCSLTTVLFGDELETVVTEEADLVFADVFDDIFRSLDCFSCDAAPIETVDKEQVTTERGHNKAPMTESEVTAEQPTASDTSDCTPEPVRNADNTSIVVASELSLNTQLCADQTNDVVGEVITPSSDINVITGAMDDIQSPTEETTPASDVNVITGAMDSIQSPTDELSSDYFNVAFSQAALRFIPTAASTAAGEGGGDTATDTSSRRSTEAVLQGDAVHKTPTGTHSQQRDNRTKRSRSPSHGRSSKRRHRSHSNGRSRRSRDRSHSNSRSRRSRDRSHSNSRSRRSRDRSHSNSRLRRSRDRSHSNSRSRRSRDRSHSNSRSRRSRDRSHSNSRSRRSRDRSHSNRSRSRERRPAWKYNTSKQRRGPSSGQRLAANRDDFASFWLHDDPAGGGGYEGQGRQLAVHSTPFGKENVGKAGCGDARPAVNSWKQRNRSKASGLEGERDYEEYNDDWRVDVQHDDKLASKGTLSKYRNAEADLFPTGPQKEHFHDVNKTVDGSSESAEKFSFDWTADVGTSDRSLVEQSSQQGSDEHAQPTDYDPFCPTDEASPTVPPPPLLAVSRSRQGSPVPPTNVTSALAGGCQSTVADGNACKMADGHPSMMVLLPPPLPPPGFGIGPAVTLTFPRPVPPPRPVALSSSVRPLFPAVMPPAQPLPPTTTTTVHNVSSAAVDVYSPFGDDMDDEDRLAWEEERAVEIMVCQRRDVDVAPPPPPLSIGSPSPVPFVGVGASPSYDDGDSNDRQLIAPQWLGDNGDTAVSPSASAMATRPHQLMEVVDMDVESAGSVSPIASPVAEDSYSPPSLRNAVAPVVDIASPTLDIASPIADDILSPPCSPSGNASELDLIPKIIPTFAVLPGKKVAAVPARPLGKSVPANQSAAKLKSANRTRDAQEMAERVLSRRDLATSRSPSASLYPSPLPKPTPDTRTGSSVSSAPVFSTQSLASELLKTAQSANRKHQQVVAVETRKLASATDVAKSADVGPAVATHVRSVAQPKRVAKSRLDDGSVDCVPVQPPAVPRGDTPKYGPEMEIPAKGPLVQHLPTHAQRNAATLDSTKKSESALQAKQQQQQQPVVARKVPLTHEASLRSSVQTTSAGFKSAQQTTKQPEIFRPSQPTVVVIAEVNRTSEGVQPKLHQPVYETMRAVDNGCVSSVAQTSAAAQGQGQGLFERLKAAGLVAPPPVARETEKPLPWSERDATCQIGQDDNSEVASGSTLLPSQVIKKPTTVQSLLEAFRLPSRPPSNQAQDEVAAATAPQVSALSILEALKLTSLLTARNAAASDFAVTSSNRGKTRHAPLPLPDLSGVVSPSPGDTTDTCTPDGRDDEYIMKLSRRERVIEEVKKALRPFYSRRQITKDDYKDVLRKAVPKICNSKSGEINPCKIKDYVDRYVLKEMQLKKYLAKKHASDKLTDSGGGATSGSHDDGKHRAAASKKHKDKRSRGSDRDKPSSRKQSILTLPLPKPKR